MSLKDAQRIEADVVVTGEAVALQVKPASILLRMLSGLIDLVTLALLGVMTYILFLAFVLRQNLAQGLTFTFLFGAFWLIAVPCTIETLTRGYSLGRYICGNRVVRDDGGPITFRHAFIRALLGVFEIWMTLGAVAVVVAMINRNGKRVGDFLAGTYEVAQPTANRRLPLIMPPEMDQWAHQAHVTEIPTPLSVSARRFLQGASNMMDREREQLGREFASQIEAYVSPPPPLGVHPERFIAAALVVRRDYEYRENLRRSRDMEDRRARAERPPYEL